MTAPDLEQACAPDTASLREVMQVIDRHASSMSVLVDPKGRVVGVVTDGDVRRAILAGATVDDPALPHATTTPHVVREGSPRALVLDLMRAWASRRFRRSTPSRGSTGCTRSATSSAPSGCRTSRWSWPGARGPGWAT